MKHMPMQGRSTVKDLRRVNRERVLRHIFFGPPVSRLDVSQRLGLSPATVTTLVSELLDEGIVVESGTEESEGGRPRTLLTVNPHHGAFIGVDVGETLVRAELFDLTLVTRDLAEHHVVGERVQPEQIVTAIGACIDELLASSARSLRQLIGVGVGVPGLVDIATGVSVFAPNWGWREVPLLQLLTERLNVPVYLDNGAKAMAQAEQWLGAGRGVEHLAVLLIGTGVGSSIITDGHLYRGATNSAGEWGHTSIERMGRPCRCGSRGCLEAYVGAPAIIARLHEAAPMHPLVQADDQKATIDAMIVAARAGDRVVQQVLHETVEYLGVGVANLINLFNPQCILLGGWTGLALGDLLLRDLMPAVAHYALADPFRSTNIALCALGEDAVCKGAATLALNAFFSAARYAARPTTPTITPASAVL
jgi:glucokinase-like ROK family protein